jgi:hypothetical protein
MAWHTSPIKTSADMLDKEFVVGGTGVGSVMLMYPALLNMLTGTRIKVVAGYADGSNVYLAMERGEVMGACGPFLTTIKATLPGWITGKKFVVPIAIYPRRLADLPDTPAITEFIRTISRAPCSSLALPSPTCSARSLHRLAFRTSGCRNCAQPSSPP